MGAIVPILPRIKRDADIEVSRIERAAALSIAFCTLNTDIIVRIPARPATTPVMTTSVPPAFLAKCVDATSSEKTVTSEEIATVAPFRRSGSKRLNAAIAATIADTATVNVIKVP